MSALLATWLATVTAVPLPVPMAEVGASLLEQRLRVGIGAEWYPFSDSMGQGLPAVGGRASMFTVLDPQGHIGLGLGVCYGRPRPDVFWASFEGSVYGIGSWAASHADTERASVLDLGSERMKLFLAPAAAVRVGYSWASLRLSAFISRRERALAYDYYGLTLEARWWE